MGPGRGCLPCFIELKEEKIFFFLRPREKNSTPSLLVQYILAELCCQEKHKGPTRRTHHEGRVCGWTSELTLGSGWSGGEDSFWAKMWLSPDRQSDPASLLRTWLLSVNHSLSPCQTETEEEQFRTMVVHRSTTGLTEAPPPQCTGQPIAAGIMALSDFPTVSTFNKRAPFNWVRPRESWKNRHRGGDGG